MTGQELDSETVESPRPGDTRAAHRKFPVRMCVGCRRRAPVGALLRVVAKDGQAVVDERRRLPGRGAWLHPEPECLAKAERRRAFPRALRTSGTLDVTVVRRHLGRTPGERAGDGLPPGSKRRKQVDPS